ncbi:homeobox protein not2 [Amia ocellicauda]|uniref:homeobox protein not2 n=1 Tax=Amia ocellicauda TaxID=2972642 RepID=UPI003464318A
MKATSHNASSYPAPWAPIKVPATRMTHKSPFSIEAILSMGPRELVQHSPAVWGEQRGHSYPATPALPLWLPAGPSQPSAPYCHYYTGYQPQLLSKGYDPNGKLMSKKNYVRRTCRRIRTIFTDEQLRRLEEVFSKQRYMTGTEKVLLASALQLTETQVKVWFQNRRTRWRKTQEDKGVRPQERDSSPGPDSSSAVSGEDEENELISVDEGNSWPF